MGLTELQSLHDHLPRSLLVPQVEGDAPAGLVHQKLGHQDLGHPMLGPQQVGNQSLGCPEMVEGVLCQGYFEGERRVMIPDL